MEDHHEEREHAHVAAIHSRQFQVAQHRADEQDKIPKEEQPVLRPSGAARELEVPQQAIEI